MILQLALSTPPHLGRYRYTAAVPSSFGNYAQTIDQIETNAGSHGRRGCGPVAVSRMYQRGAGGAVGDDGLAQ